LLGRKCVYDCNWLIINRRRLVDLKRGWTSRIGAVRDNQQDVRCILGLREFGNWGKIQGKGWGNID